MSRIFASFFALAVSCSAQQYQFVSLTGTSIYRFATARAVSQSGTAVGSVNAFNTAAVFSPQLGTILPSFAMAITGVNAAGDIIGSTNYGGFLSHVPYDAYIDLSSVGSPIAINDRGDMIGTPFLNTTWFPGLNIYPFAINNLGQVLGVVASSPNYQYYLYTPGIGDTALPTTAQALNNNGDILFAPYGGAAYIQTASAQIPLPSGYTWTAFNDSDQAVGYGTATGAPVYFSTATGLVDLSTQFQNTQNIVSTTPEGITDSGEILVNFQWKPDPAEPVAPVAGVALLIPIPVGAAVPAPVSHRRPEPAAPRTMNGKAVVLAPPVH
jgi:hypothetical protein